MSRANHFIQEIPHNFAACHSERGLFLTLISSTAFAPVILSVAKNPCIGLFCKLRDTPQSLPQAEIQDSSLP
jgi:hypothetical protein